MPKFLGGPNSAAHGPRSTKYDAIFDSRQQVSRISQNN